MPDDKFFIDVEKKLVGQMQTFSHFGNVIELFIPNALQTVVKMIGGADDDVKKHRHASPDGSRHWVNRPIASPGRPGTPK